MAEGQTRLDKALERLKQKGLNGLIIYSDGTNSILLPSYLHYFSGFKPLGPHNAVILSASGRMALLVEPAWDSLRASERSWIRDVRGSSDFLKDLPRILQEFRISGALGLAGSGAMTAEIYDRIGREATLVPADDMIEEIARERTEQEIDLVRKVAHIADVGSVAFLKGARVGIREYELSAEVEYSMRAAGADDIFILMSSGKHNHEMHEPTDRRLQQGDIVIGEITPVCEGQFVQLCRTVILGKASPILEEKYRILVRALEESLMQIRTGAPASLITTAMNRVIGEAGYGRYCQPPYMRARGHGFGVGSIAPGAEITEQMKTNLEKYQILAVHPNQYLPETGYLACGETVVVTDTGIERLAKTETKLYERLET